MFKIWYMAMILYYLFFCAVHMMQRFVYAFSHEKMLQGTYDYYQDNSFLSGNEENSAFVVSNVHKRTSAPDGASFGSKGLSMYTTTLVHLIVDLSREF
jgi:hypothetical protein